MAYTISSVEPFGKTKLPVVSFPFHGGIKENELNDLDFEMSENKKEKKLYIEGETDLISFEGKDYEEGNKLNDTSKLLVAIVNHNNKNIQIYDSGHVFSLRSTAVSASENRKDPKKREHENLGYFDSKKLLVDSFGSKKKQKLLKAMTANRIDVNSIAMGGGSITEEVKEIAISDIIDKTDENADQAIDPLEQSRRAVLPPFNQDAKTPEEVFDPHQLIGEDAYSVLVRQLKEALEQSDSNGKKKKKSIIPADDENNENDEDQPAPSNKKSWQEYLMSNGYWPEFIRTRLLKIREALDVYTKEYVRNLIYLRHLIVFHQGPMSFYKSNEVYAEKFSIPELLLQTLKDKFTSQHIGNKRMEYKKTKESKTKLILYILAMSLIINGFSLVTSELAEELKLPPQSCAIMLKELGCSITAAKKKSIGASAGQVSYIANLTIPLKFPELRRSKKSKN